MRFEALRLLGISGEPDEELEAELEESYEHLLRVSAPRITYKIFDIKPEDGAIAISPALSLEGAALEELCRGCERAVLLAATLGAGVDRLIARRERESISRAVILDACASAEIERICDEAEPSIIAGKVRNGEDIWLTMRFSPGYGGVSPEESVKIIEALGAGKSVGLSLTRSGMLVPTKSVTAVIGIANEPRKRYRTCDMCAAFQNCPYREKGDFCGDRS